jgi:hypothetical protein
LTANRFINDDLRASPFFYFALPNDERRPAGFSKLQNCLPIPSDVFIQFIVPKFGIRFGAASFFAAFMLMQKHP